jgi:glycosyltransferase involved in cell wall biosynthesis
LTVKEVVARLSPEKFHVQMLYMETPDERIANRPNTQLIRYGRHWNTAKLLGRCLWSRPDSYFFPREGPLDAAFLWARQWLGLRTKLVTYLVMTQENGPFNAVLGRAAKEADALVGNSKFVSETIEKWYGKEATTIHSGVSRNLYHPPVARIASQRLRVLFAGSFQKRKRPGLVIQEAAKWPDVHFRLAGRGEEEKPCRELAKELRCGNVEFLGHLTSAELGEEMRQADVFLFPSVIEGHPQVLGQAAACGLPCIAMDVYRPDYVVNGKTGFLVRSEVELSEKLKMLLSQAELRRSMSVAAVQHSLQFDWDRVVEHWERLFERVVEQQPG